MAALPAGRRLRHRAPASASKRLRTVERLLEAASAMGAERGDAWVGVGGGTTTDLVGAAAALYLRGVPFVALPTTWLGMTDAAIGGKVGVDLSAAKNAAGAFWPPVAIVGDMAALRTLPPRATPATAWPSRSRAGSSATRPVAARRDPRPGGPARRRGRPLRHHRPLRPAQARASSTATPSRPASGASSTWATRWATPWRSRAAIACRTARPSCWACAPWPPSPPRAGAEPDLAERIDDVVGRLGYRLRRAFDPAVVTRALGSDKKRLRGRQRWILPMAVGRVDEVDDVTDAELEAALRVIQADETSPEAASAGDRRTARP